MKKSLIAVLTASAFLAMPLVASAQDTMTEPMTMLETAVNNAFTKLGITEYKMEDLTLGELSEIKSVVSTNDYNDEEKKMQIMQIIDR